ncbi:MAG: neutral/alkaline non-lysosomal ceramidase N-terminal domain-containing protein [Opitutaceae bacterium]|nr:neutral/alkaline non-lysosomal ceramidase N-terminal domain-containing protein [Opitutaceae bacterium]
MRLASIFRQLVLIGAVGPAVLFAAAPLVSVGVARADITPELPIQLAGYQQRTTEATRVGAPMSVRALAIGSDQEGPVVLVVADVIAVNSALSDAVAAAVRARHPRIGRERVAVCATHQHNGPAIAGTIPFMFSRDLPADVMGRLEKFTVMLREKMITAALAALADRKPARLAWAQGWAGFAVNRRRIVDGKHAGYTDQPGGVVDHALPVLRATDAAGGVRAVLANYACHCTVLKGGENFVHHDWAGDAAQRVEAAHAGAVALVTIGCGADSDPQPRGLAEVATHGKTIAAEVARVTAGAMRPLGRVTAAKFERVAIPLARVVSRAELESRLKEKPNIAYAAAQHLKRLDAGQPLPAAISYPVQAWAFGHEFAMVFLGGEVVADYGLRLKRELGVERVWVNAYANDVPCYIPSTRILAEGGYEAEAAMDYYGLPTRLASDVEERIVRAVHGVLPAGFAVQR